MRTVPRVITAVVFLASFAACAPRRWIVEGCAATPELDMNGVLIEERALRGAAEGKIGYPTVLMEHDHGRPIGRLLCVAFVGGELLVAAEISRTEPRVWAKIADGTLTGLSVGFVPVAWEEGYSPEREIVFKRISKMIIIEVSVVSIPSNPRARIKEIYRCR